jgi:hypothetical protein
MGFTDNLLVIGDWQQTSTVSLALQRRLRLCVLLSPHKLNAHITGKNRGHKGLNCENMRHNNMLTLHFCASCTGQNLVIRFSINIT